MWRILFTWHTIGLQLQISNDWNKNGYILLMLSWGHYKVSTIWPETSTNERSPGQCEIEQPQFPLAGSYSIRILQPKSFLTKNIQIWLLPALQNLHLHSSVTIFLMTHQFIQDLLTIIICLSVAKSPHPTSTWKMIAKQLQVKWQKIPSLRQNSILLVSTGPIRAGTKLLLLLRS